MKAKLHKLRNKQSRKMCRHCMQNDSVVVRYKRQIKPNKMPMLRSHWRDHISMYWHYFLPNIWSRPLCCPPLVPWPPISHPSPEVLKRPHFGAFGIIQRIIKYSNGPSQIEAADSEGPLGKSIRQTSFAPDAIALPLTVGLRT
jgi:hypothetical protein